MKNAYAPARFRRFGLWLLLLLLNGPAVVAQYVQKQKLAAKSADRKANAGFGMATAVNGNIMVVGAPTENTNTGAAYVFERANGTWTQTARLVADDGGTFDFFGAHVAVSGTTIVVGAVNADAEVNGSSTFTGAVYVFTKNGVNWPQTHKLVASDRAESDQFGASVALDGNTLVVGALFQKTDATGNNAIDGAGAAYVFTRSGNTWTQAQKLAATDRAEKDGFGGEVAVSGTTVAVGAHWKDVNALDQAGAVYVFTKPGNAWSQAQKLTSPVPDEKAFFGGELALSPSVLVVGANAQDADANGANPLDGAGAAYIFEKSGNAWSLAKTLTAPPTDRDANDQFGASVAVLGSTVAVGSIGEETDANGQNSLNYAGAVYVFAKSGGAWSQTQKFTASDRQADASFGYGVAMSGATLTTGAPNQTTDANGANPLTKAGAAYTFGNCVPPTFSFTTTPASGSAVNLSNANGPASGPFQVCAGLNQAVTYSNLTRSSTHVGILGKTTAADGNGTGGGATIAVEGYFDLGTGAGLNTFFTYSFGPYGVKSGSQSTFSQEYLPYVDANENGLFDTGECLGDPLTVNVTINAKPYFGFTVASNGVASQAVSDQNGPASFSAKVCVGSNSALQFSGFSRSTANVGALLQTTATTGKPTYFGNAITAGAPQDLGTETTFTNFFVGTFGGYGIADNATQATFTQTYTPYVDLNGDTNYDAGECLGDPITVTVTINALPAPTFVGLLTSYCKSVGAFALAGNPAGGTFTVDGNAATQFDPSALTTGSHTVVYTYADPATGCSNSVSQDVTVNALPVLNSATASPNPVCLDGTLSLEASATGGTGTLTYDWSGPEGYDPAAATTNPLTRSNATAQFAGTYSVTVTDGNGCQATGQTAAVVVEQPGFSGAASVGANLAVCPGQPVVVSFAVGSCAFAAGNQFAVQLSDANGGWGSPVVLNGVVNAGQITVTIPANTPAGTGYRVRVASSQPSLTSGESGTFTVNGAGSGGSLGTPTTAAKTCQGDPFTVTFSAASGCGAPAYTVQLSNAFGSFANPTILGPALPGTTTFPASALAGLPVGTGYRVRVVSEGQVSAASLPFKLEGPSLSGVAPAVGGAPVCRGNAVTIGFSLPAGSCPFPNGNTFTAQLSSATGSFNNPTTLGTVLPDAVNTLTIPAGAAAGSGYRIRIVSSNPVVTSSNSSPFQVKACNNRMSAEDAHLVVMPNPVRGDEIRVRAAGMDNPAFTLTALTGRSVDVSAKTDGSGEWVLTPRQRLLPGVYALQATEGQTRLATRVLVVE